MDQMRERLKRLQNKKFGEIFRKSQGFDRESEIKVLDEEIADLEKYLAWRDEREEKAGVDMGR